MRERLIDKLLGDVLNTLVSLHQISRDCFSVQIDQQDVFTSIVGRLVDAVGGGMIVSFGGADGDRNHLLCDAGEAVDVLRKLAMKHTCSVYLSAESNFRARYWTEQGMGGIDAQGMFWPALERIVRAHGGLEFGKKRLITSIRNL